MVLWQPDVGAEESMVVVVGGDETGAGVAVEREADGAAVGGALHVGLPEERREALVEGDGTGHIRQRRHHQQPRRKQQRRRRDEQRR